MKRYTFRVTQPLAGYYEGEVSISAESEEKAREELKKMNSFEIEKLCSNWEQAVGDTEPDGNIEIYQLINEI